MDVRLGNGYDVHAFCDGDHVWLCGVKVPHSRGLLGHSDADVGMHALTDAIYGALAMGDIGRHFPPSDPQWKGAASHIFLAHAIDDTGVVIEHSRRYQAACKAQGVPVRLLELPDGGHGLNGYKGPSWDAWQRESLAWLQQLPPKTGP